MTSLPQNHRIIFILGKLRDVFFKNFRKNQKSAALYGCLLLTFDGEKDERDALSDEMQSGFVFFGNR